MEISNLIKTTNVIETKGKEILKKNDFFKKLINLMNSHEFNDFYESYFNDWSDIETIIFTSNYTKPSITNIPDDLKMILAMKQ